jgi:DNA polymerase-1
MPRYADVPWDMVSKYARQDVKLTYRLFEWQYDWLEIEGGPTERRLVSRELEFAKVVLAMEQRGIGFDPESAHAAATWLEEQQNAIASALPFRTTLPAAKAYFFGDLPGALHLEPLSYTKKGAPALPERDVADLAAREVPHAKIFHRHQALKAMVTKWYGPWPRLQGEDGRLRPSFNLTNVRSHRLSVQRVQVQAIPHIRHFLDLDLDPGLALPRELFRARPKHRLWEVDLAQGEVRIATAITGCRGMREIISIPNSDVHGETCKRIFGSSPTDPDWKSRRDMAKRLTFGTVYGAGVRKLVDTAYLDTGIRVPESEMRAMVDYYKKEFPEFFQFAREAGRACEQNGYVTLISGKRRYFNFGEPLWEKPHTAFNACIQGGLAETMRDVMILVEKEMPGMLLLQIHDSLVLEIPKRSPDGTDEEHARFARDCMIDVYQKQYGVRFEAEAAPWEDKA